MNRVGMTYWKDRKEEADVALLYSDGQGLITEAETQEIITDIGQGLAQYDITGYFASQPGIFNRYEHAVIARDKQDSRTVGLLGTRWFRSDECAFLYLWTGMVAERTQRRKLTQRMFAWLWHKVLEVHEMPAAVVAKTYNPVWYLVMRRIAEALPGSRLYPEVGGKRQDDEMTSLVLKVHRLLAPTLELRIESGVLLEAQKAIGGSGFWPTPPPISGDEQVDRHFESHCSKEDQIIQVLATAGIASRHGEIPSGGQI